MLISNLTYAIGDIHGKSDLLEPLLDFIQRDADRRQQEPKVIFLGDIVDRGPDSKRCIEPVISTLDRLPKSKLIFGNHDDLFLRVLGTDDPDRVVVDAWIRNGGLPTICNYDYEPDLGLARIAVKTEYKRHLTLFEKASFLEVDGCARWHSQKLPVPNCFGGRIGAGLQPTVVREVAMDQPSPKAPPFCTLEENPVGRRIRAAQYMRMSTDLQKYSIENQAAAIAAYAIQRNFSIVRSYQDDGRSGLHIDGRDALKELIETVQRGRADFEAILVYDVSRWGRFQNTDESAYYEFICSEAGIRIHYCAEQFENDGSLLSTIIKNIKRAMAAEYSRELSTKVFAGHCRLVRMGFRQGGPPGYGLRRMLVDENRQPKVLLKPGERKCLQTDHVVLRPGNSREVKVVRHIFDLFVQRGKSESQIACELNADGVLNHYGRAWSGSTVRNLLRNENYIGNNVYNRMNLRLGQKARRNPPDLVIRAPEVFEPIVDKSIFLQAQEKIQPQRRLLLTSDEMLSRLRTVLQEKGRLSRTIIDKSPILPTNDVYAWRFGGLKNAYSLIGYFPDENFRNVEAKHALVETLSATADEIVAGIENSRQWAIYDPATSVLTVNGALTVSITIARCVRDRKWPRWISSRRIDYTRDLYLAARMNETNSTILDYLLLPAPQMLELKRISFAQKKLRQLRDYRIKNIDGLIRAILAYQKHRDSHRTVVGKNGIGK